MAMQDKKAEKIVKHDLQKTEELPPTVEALLREIERLRKQVTQLERLHELLFDIIHQVVRSLPPVKPPELERKRERMRKLRRFGDHYAIALFSDCQIGQFVMPAETVGRERYSLPIFEERAWRWRDRVILLVDILRTAYSIPDLCIFVLGDCVEGEAQFPGQAALLDADAYTQICHGTEVVARIFRSWCKQFRNVYFVTVAGNHGRPKTKHDISRFFSLDLLFLAYLKERLRAQDNFQMFISDSPLMGVRVANWDFLLLHGHQIRAYVSLPYYGVERFVARATLLTHKVWDFVCLGHHHRQASLSFGEVPILFNPSWVGGNLYVTERIHSISRPAQLLLIIHPEVGLVAELPIYLAELRGLVLDERTGLWTPPLEEAQKQRKGKKA